MHTFDDLQLGVFCCGHVFRHERLTCLVYHGRDWEFHCGGIDHPDRRDLHLVHVGALLSFDPTLNQLADLPRDWEAERRDIASAWIKTGPTASDA